MALLIVNLDKQTGNAQMWRDTFVEQCPNLEVRVSSRKQTILQDVEYLAFIRPDFDAIPPLPNLKAMSAPPASKPLPTTLLLKVPRQDQARRAATR